jgi:hypothetical protein
MPALPIALPPKLRVTTAETEHMPFYLRIFFRVLSSWVHGWSLPTDVPDWFDPPASSSTKIDGQLGIASDRYQAGEAVPRSSSWERTRPFSRR